ncbi:MAG: Gfo/Idh/MocA family oxidoreductase, partial [Clostridia bacterium]
MIRTIIIGCGARGFETYGRYAKRAGSGMQIVALCDNKGDKLEIARKELNIDKSDCYLDADELLSRGKIGDLAIISTYDREHFNYAMKAIELGYNLLLEKPISNTLSECIAIR